jgi:hypothetical protein
MYDTINDLLEAFRATPEILTALLDNVSQEQAQSAKGGDEGWSVVEVVCHLRDAEEIAVQRMETIRDQDDPLIHGYDQEELARKRNYAADDLRSALAGFMKFRERHITGLSALTPQQWERPGQHSELGTVTIMNHTQHMAAHDAVHCAQIARQLAKNR